MTRKVGENKVGENNVEGEIKLLFSSKTKALFSIADLGQ